jgi:predicted nucleotidyltransferase component of viral defense system
MIAAALVADYGNALCFKGGFVLRHVYGNERFSKDIDTTTINAIVLPRVIESRAPHQARQVRQMRLELVI